MDTKGKNAEEIKRIEAAKNYISAETNAHEVYKSNAIDTMNHFRRLAKLPEIKSDTYAGKKGVDLNSYYKQ